MRMQGVGSIVFVLDRGSLKGDFRRYALSCCPYRATLFPLGLPNLTLHNKQ
jgi:hypothetical protein